VWCFKRGLGGGFGGGGVGVHSVSFHGDRRGDSLSVKEESNSPGKRRKRRTKRHVLRKKGSEEGAMGGDMIAMGGGEGSWAILSCGNE